LIDQARRETADDLPELPAQSDSGSSGGTQKPQTSAKSAGSAGLTDVALGSRENYAYVGLGSQWDNLTSARNSLVQQLSGNLTESEKTQLQKNADLLATNIQGLQIARAAREFGLTMARDMYKNEQIISDTWKTAKVGKTTKDKRADQQEQDESELEEMIASGELDAEDADGYKSNKLRQLEQQEQLDATLRAGGLASSGTNSTFGLST
jgi:hypothetical protein